MKRTHPRTTTVSKRIGVLVLLLLGVWLLSYCIRSQLPEVSALVVAHTPLPARHAFAKYLWLSPHEVLIGTQNARGDSVLWQLDIRSKQSRELTGLNQLFRDLKGADGALVNWNVASDTSAVMCISGVPGSLTATVADLSGRILSEATRMSGDLTRVYSPIWLSGPKGWLVPGLSSNVTIGLGSKGAPEAVQLILCTDIAFPIGVRGESNIVLLRAQHAPNVSTMRLIEVTLADKASTRSYDIHLPFECQVVTARLSPSGKRILWELRRTSSLPKLRTSASFPFLKLRKDIGQSSLWISNGDGTSFVGLGSFQDEMFTGNFLEWHPDEGRISVILDGELVLLEVPNAVK